jgi:hypothetical protein
MTTKLTHHRATANGIRQHYVEAGSGPPVGLLHGFPETWYAWRHQIMALAKHFRISRAREGSVSHMQVLQMVDATERKLIQAFCGSPDLPPAD